MVQWYGLPNGFPTDLGGLISIDNPNINNIYADFVSITYGSNLHKHTWTFRAGMVDNLANLQCWLYIIHSGSYDTNTPTFGGSDYYSESGIADKMWSSVCMLDMLCEQQCGGLERHQDAMVYKDTQWDYNQRYWI